ASAAELASLPGIGPSKAQAIVEHRAKEPFTRAEDLRKVKGIGPKLYDAIREQITVGDAPAPSGRGGSAAACGRIRGAGRLTRAGGPSPPAWPRSLPRSRRFVAKRVIDEDERGHGLDHRDRARQHAGIVSPAPGDGRVLTSRAHGRLLAHH